MDRLASISAFVRVAESGGFSAAARRLHLSKATVSEQVAGAGKRAGRTALEPNHKAGQPDRGRTRVLRALHANSARPGGG
jgi:DNA-binding transcriptional LysR family regulator